MIFRKKDISRPLRRILIILMCAVLAITMAACDSKNDKDNSSSNSIEEETPMLLKDKYQPFFPVGATIKTGVIDNYSELLKNFNSITMETEMKWENNQPEEGRFTFDAADKLIDYAVANGKVVRGHALVWYKQLPSWVITEETTKEEALQRIRDHIRGVMTHYAEKYGDTVYCWDVVNEALADGPTQEQVDAGNYYRTGAETAVARSGDWYALCGVDFIKESFKAADEVRRELGRDIKLYYNDYGLNLPAKRDAALKMIKELQDDNIPIDGIGMQGHYYLGSFKMDEFEKSVKAFTSLGLDVQVTELDVSIYPYNGATDTVYDELPESLDALQGAMFGGIYRIGREYSVPKESGHGRFTGVTIWGVADDGSWLNNSAQMGRKKNWPLLFDYEYQPKTAFKAIMNF